MTRIVVIVAAALIVASAVALSAPRHHPSGGGGGTPPPPPTLTETPSPSPPITIADSAALGAINYQFTNTWSSAEAFVGANTFASPNWDADRFTLSGDYVIIAPLGPGVSGDGGTTKLTTTVAVQMDMSVDHDTSVAPGGMLANKWGIWSWGPLTAGRSMNGWGGLTPDYVVYLNGSEVGTATTMEVAGGGALYAYSTHWTAWFVWNGSAFVGSGPPP